MVEEGMSFKPLPGQNVNELQVKNAVNNSLGHVEGHGVATLIDNNLTHGRIYINNVDGPCDDCQIALPHILPKGGSLEVIYKNKAGQTIRDRFYHGQNFDPNVDRRID